MTRTLNTPDGARHSILLEEGLTDYQGHEVRVLLCEYALPPGEEWLPGATKEYVIFTEMIAHPAEEGFYPADTFIGNPTPTERRQAFEDAIFYATHGYHRWTVCPLCGETGIINSTDPCTTCGAPNPEVP